MRYWLPLEQSAVLKPSVCRHVALPRERRRLGGRLLALPTQFSSPVEMIPRGALNEARAE